MIDCFLKPLICVAASRLPFSSPLESHGLILLLSKLCRCVVLPWRHFCCTGAVAPHVKESDKDRFPWVPEVAQLPKDRSLDILQCVFDRTLLAYRKLLTLAAGGTASTQSLVWGCTAVAVKREFAATWSLVDGPLRTAQDIEEATLNPALILAMPTEHPLRELKETPWPRREKGAATIGDLFKKEEARKDARGKREGSRERRRSRSNDDRRRVDERDVKRYRREESSRESSLKRTDRRRR
jgi:hypothetical protein